MVRTDLWTALADTQKYISKYYATALTDESKHDQLKSYIEKFILDTTDYNKLYRKDVT